MDALGRIFYEERKSELAKRVSQRRLHHIEGVAETAAELAEVYGVDVAQARLAGLLHDWDKGLDDDAIRARARELGIVEEIGEWTVERMPRVLHGPTAAAFLARAWPEIPDEVIEAIRCHTTASMRMSPLDKVLYIADAIEPSRTFEKAPWLRSLIGAVSLDELYYEVYRFWILVLIEHGTVLHPGTIDIWNQLAQQRADALGRG